MVNKIHMILREEIKSIGVGSIIGAGFSSTPQRRSEIAHISPTLLTQNACYLCTYEEQIRYESHANVSSRTISVCMDANEIEWSRERIIGSLPSDTRFQFVCRFSDINQIYVIVSACGIARTPMAEQNTEYMLIKANYDERSGRQTE